MEKNQSIERIAIRYGLLTSIGLIAYFLIMKLLGLVHIVELRVFNVFILGYGIWLGLKQYLDESGNRMVYLQTFALGSLTAVSAVVPFAIFIFSYMSWDVQFMNTVIENEWFGSYMNPYIVAFLISFEGIISSFFITFTIMQYMKKSWTEIQS